MTRTNYTSEAIEFLQQLIATPSFSKEEDQTADLIQSFFARKGIPFQRIGNNIMARQNDGTGKPLVVLNSHHDTVKPCVGWTQDPFSPTLKEEKLTGLGSNDAGGCLVSLLMTFIHCYDQALPFQLMLIASAEEEISGKNGLRRALKEWNIHPDVAIIGEPTSTQMAIAEKGLMVIDAIAQGTAGHAAHQIGDNALYNALEDIDQIRKLQFDKSSPLLGDVKLTVTQIQAGKQHNVVPDECRFVIDCRVNECYTNEEIVEAISGVCQSKLTPRSTHLRSSSIPLDHPLVQNGIKLGKTTYGSPTLSDQVFFDCPSLKIGPGDSTRSHQANEFIYVHEIEAGIQTYIELLDGLTFI